MNVNHVDLWTAYGSCTYYVNMVDQKNPCDPPSTANPEKGELPAGSREARLYQAIEQFYFGYRAFTSQPDRILEQRGLGRVHHRILYFVGRNPEISINALLAILNVSKQALNAPLRQLVEMGMVAMQTAEHDRRVRQLALTPSGRKLEAQLTRTQVKQLQGVFEQAGKAAEEGWFQVMLNLSGRD